MKRPKLFRRVLQVEMLEQRTVMAGSIAASVTSGVLRLVGDSRENIAVIWKGNNPGEVVLAGAKDSAGGNTLIGGKAQPMTFSGISQLRLNMGAGNDRILITNLSLPPVADSLAVSVGGDLGSGNDQLVVSGDTSPRNFTLNGGGAIPYGPVSFREKLSISGNVGNDKLNMLNVSNISGRATFFSGGAGDDAVYVDGSLERNQFGTLALNMGAGNDVVSIKRAQFLYDVFINDYAPGDNGSTLTTVDIYKVRVGVHVNITIDGSRSQINFDSDADPARYLSSRQIDISSGNYDDTVTARHVDSATFGLRSNFGSDQWEVVDSVFSYFSGVFDQGDDRLTVGNVTAKKRAGFDGGAGTDTFTDLGGNSFGDLTLENFE
jgi:hypothetical protein